MTSSDHPSPGGRLRGAGAYAALRPAAAGERGLSAWQRWEMSALERDALALAGNAAPEPAVNAPVFSPPLAAAQPDPLELEARRTAVEEARREGWAQGHAQGSAAGHIEGLAAGLAAASAHAEQLRALALGLPEALRRADTEIADAVVALALDIARQVVHRSLRAEPGYLLSVVQDLLRAEPALQGAPRLLLHPDDLALVRNALGGELEAAGWQLCADDALTRGGCRVRAANGERDATVETRWARVTAALDRGDAAIEGHDR